MVDHISPERRSWLMSRVKGKHTTPEVRVRRAAHAMGLRFRLHRKDLPGKPDLLFPRHRIALFVHGCFWHRHGNCSKASIPRSRIDFWKSKFEKNVSRDAECQEALRRAGWHVAVVWECETKSDEILSAKLMSLFQLD